MVGDLLKDPDGSVFALSQNLLNISISGEQSRRRLIKFNADGSVDASFCPLFTTGEFIGDYRPPQDSIITASALVGEYISLFGQFTQVGVRSYQWSSTHSTHGYITARFEDRES